MIEDIVILTLLLVPAIVAWSVPALRKMNGSWLIALKTVPVGMVTLCLSIKLLSEYHKWLCEYRLENVDAVYTKPIRFYDISKDVQGIIALEKVKGVRMSESEVHYSLGVRRYVEVTDMVAVKPVNIRLWSRSL